MCFVVSNLFPQLPLETGLVLVYDNVYKIQDLQNTVQNGERKIFFFFDEYMQISFHTVTQSVHLIMVYSVSD